MTANGQMLWHIQGNEPTLGTHPFQPAFFGSTLFAIESALNGVVASYDLQSGAVLWTQKLDDTLEYAAPFLLFGKMLYIAADHTLYALDRTNGTLLWKADRPTRTLLMFTDTHPLLLVAGPQGLAALNAYTSAIVWTYNGLPLKTQAISNETLVPAQFYQASFASTDNDTSQIQRGVVAANNIFLLYGGGTLQAIDPVDQHIIWSQKQLVDTQSLKISDDGTKVYAILDNLKPGSSTTQVLAAIDIQTGTVRWTFQSFEGERFVNAQSDGFQYHNGTLYATICSTANQTSCDEEALYTINAATGKQVWKFEANSIYNIHVSAGGDIIAFQTNNSVWENLLERFR